MTYLGCFVLQNEITTMELSQAIYIHAKKCGFDNCGILPINAAEGFDALLEERYSNVPMSKYFYGNMPSTQDVKLRFPWAKSIVILSFNYGKYRFPEQLQHVYGKAFFLSPFNPGSNAVKLDEFEKWFADNGIRIEGGNTAGEAVGPLRYLAVKAGMGIIRKNNFFYAEDGSNYALTGYVIDKTCELIQNVNVKPCPPKCDLCQRACRTHALSAPYTMNPFKCVSWCTTFGNCEVPEGCTLEMFQKWTIGCDNCQDACPFNRRHDWNTGEECSDLEEIAETIQPENYNNLSDEYLEDEVLPKTEHHIQPKDIPALRINAARATDNIQKGVCMETLEISKNKPI